MSLEKYQVNSLDPVTCTALINGIVGLEFSSDAEEKHSVYLKERTQLLKHHKVTSVACLSSNVMYSIALRALVPKLVSLSPALPPSHSTGCLARLCLGPSLLNLLCYPTCSWIYTSFSQPMPH